MVVIIALATAFLGFLVWVLFQMHKELRCQLESRVRAIEDLSEPFASKLARSGPVPLTRVLHLDIQLDERFWRETLRLSSEVIKGIQPPIWLHGDSSKEDQERFQRTGYLNQDISVHIQEWRGGYTHIDVQSHRVAGGARHSTQQKRYPGDDGRLLLWSLSLPDCKGESFWTDFPVLELGIVDSCVTLYVHGDKRFVSEKTGEPEAFLAVPLAEGCGLAPFHKQDYKTRFDHEGETCSDPYRDVEPWLRCYQDLDLEKRLAWRLWIRDCELFARSEGDYYRASRVLIDGYREKSCSLDSGCEHLYPAIKTWGLEEAARYRRLADSLEAQLEARHQRIDRETELYWARENERNKAESEETA
jgi:hypothetical protein